MNLGRCSICTFGFEPNDVSALKCGHTYHYECIDKWITNSKTCPNCRMTNLKSNIMKLFFDEGEKSFSQLVQEPTNGELLAELIEARDMKMALERTVKEHQEKAALLESKLKHQKNKHMELNMQLQRKSQHIESLEAQLFDQTELKETNETYRRRLVVCEFYNLLMRGGGDEWKIDKYINQHGKPELEKFLDLMRKQRDEEIRKNKMLNADLKKMRLEKYKSEKETENLRKEIEQLRAEIADKGKKRRVDGMAGPSKETASDQQRSSFGFSFTKPDDKGEVVHAAKNFAFEGDSSIEILSDSDKNAYLKPHLLEFDPISPSAVKCSHSTFTNRGGNKLKQFEQELSEVFSSNLLNHAKKCNI